MSSVLFSLFQSLLVCVRQLMARKRKIIARESAGARYTKKYESKFPLQELRARQKLALRRSLFVCLFVWCFEEASWPASECIEATLVRREEWRMEKRR